MRAPFLNAVIADVGRTLTRRGALRRLLAGAGTAVLAQGKANPAAAQDATPEAGACVATAPPAADGVGLATLLAGGVVHDMPAGPVKVGIYRFTLEPSAGVPPAAAPYPALMHIETGASSCPGGKGKINYGADGAVLGTSDGQIPHLCPAGTTWYIPAGIPDGADNLGADLMSSLVIEFVPVEPGAAGTPEA